MSAAMDIEDDDDFYGEEETKETKPTSAEPEKKPETKADDLEEGEEEDEGAAMDEDDDDDSDVEIVTERKDGTTAPPPTTSKYSDIRNIPQRSTASDAATTKEEPKPDANNVAAPSADSTARAASKSNIDIDNNPIYPAAGKPITQVNIDEDLPDNDKPWRKPGTDISDYFNYGFDEFTWALYAAKQENIRGEFGADAFANGNKMMEDMGMAMGGGAGAGGMPGGMDMQQMMQQMAASGMDPNQMDFSQMSAMFGGMQGQGGQQGGQGQGFGGGYGGQQGYGGYDQNMGGGGGGGRGGFGRGRGRRGGW